MDASNRAKRIEFDNKSNGTSPEPHKYINEYKNILLSYYHKHDCYSCYSILYHKLCAETLRLHSYLVGTRLFDYTVIWYTGI